MTAHQPVLLSEVLEWLAPETGAVVVDATCGAGGHTERLAEVVGGEGRVIALDRDAAAIAAAQARLSRLKQITFVNGNFRGLTDVLAALHLRQVDGILADLGVSSVQLTDPARGFSFHSEAELDMRLDQREPVTAASLLRQASEEELGRIFREYGEERRWKALARAVVAHRSRGGRFTGPEFRRLVHAVLGRPRSGRIDSSTRAFMALRLAVNDELGALADFLNAAVAALKPDGRLAVISFHSLEDRLVKNSFRQAERGCCCPASLPRCVCGQQPVVRVLTRKPIQPGEEEVRGNPRARSAKLRVAQKLPALAGAAGRRE